MIVLGILKNESLSAYDIQKLVEYRYISQWVKISTPSIYKKVIALEQKGFIKSTIAKEGKMPQKAIYSLTEKGKTEFEKLMTEISAEPINIFLDFNAVIVNLKSLDKEKRKACLDNIEKNIEAFKAKLEENLSLKENNMNISKTGMAVLKQQYILAKALEEWLSSLKEDIDNL